MAINWHEILEHDNLNEALYWIQKCPAIRQIQIRPTIRHYDHPEKSQKIFDKYY